LVKFSQMDRGQVIALALAGLVFVVGFVEVAREVGSVTGWLAKSAKHGTNSGKNGKVTTINNAKFDYLVPEQGGDWKFDDDKTAYDQAKGVVKYTATLQSVNVDVTISQQVMPEELKPRGSAKFEGFIKDAKPTTSQKAGDGTVYFLPALENGAPANGSDIIIYATDDRLLFGRAGRVLGYDVWAKLLAGMTKTSPK
jgi:hypothetical protein